MQDLDVGNMDAIKERIAQATSHEQVAEVANDFMKFYGKEGQLLNQADPKLLGTIHSLNKKNTPLENLKASVLGTMSAVSFFPKSIIKTSFDFERVEYGTAAHTMDQHGTVTVTGAGGEMFTSGYNNSKVYPIGSTAKTC